MKPLLTFSFHLVIATLVVPMLALISGSVMYRIVRYITASDMTPQRFYSDHLFMLVAETGLWLAYLVCDTFTGKSATWIWIPALLLFGVRIAFWRSTASVLVHSSVFEHFFTANCQIETWHDTGFVERCADKLFLMQLVVSAFAYSAGAAIHNSVGSMRQRES